MAAIPSPRSAGLNHLGVDQVSTPPITKATLSELDVNKIIHNPKLLHDINFDSELHFTPNLDGSKGRKKQDVATQFWAALKEELQNYVKGGGQSDGVDTASSLFTLLTAVREILKMLVDQRDVATVSEALDLELLAQQMARGTANPGKLTESLRYFLKQRCVPIWHESVDMACDILTDGVRNNDSRILVDGLQSLFSVMESMRRDIPSFLHNLSTNPLDSSSLIWLDEPAPHRWVDEPAPHRWVDEPAPDGWVDEPAPDGWVDEPAPYRWVDELYGWLKKPTSFRPQTWIGRASEWTVFGKVMGALIAALPDTGADACFISPELAIMLGLAPQPGSERSVKLANGKEIISPGSVDIQWNFLNEKEMIHMTCWILPGCTHQIILGSKFLEETKSLTTRRHRIQRKYVSIPKSISVKLLGEGKQRLWGYLNDNFVAALPDTGSDVMIISLEYARRLGLKIYSGPGGIVEVEFVDGSTSLTSGIVRDVAWSSGCHSIRCDFLVLDNISVDVILAKDYLFDMDIFSNCTNYLTEDDDMEQLDIYGIRLVRVFGDRFGTALDQLEDDSIEDVLSQGAFSPEMINREWARRDRIRDVIEALDETRRVEAEAAEERRQEQWERARVAHRQRWAQTPNPSQPPASTIARPSGPPQRNPPVTTGSRGRTPSNQQPPPENASSRMRWPKRARVSIPLLPLRRNGDSHPPPNVG
ncbi:T-complex protein 11-domain-containing protein [Nemania sp. FL0031]|nr:T-complex protein 11-domain-containing protein [Nemania sp. FL0031]